MVSKKHPVKKHPLCVVVVQPDIHARIRKIVDRDGRKIRWFVEMALLEALASAELDRGGG